MGFAVKPGVPLSMMKQLMPAAPLRRVGADEHHAPLRLVRVRDERLGPVEDPVAALLHPAAPDGIGGVGAAARLGDGEERAKPVAQRGHRVLLDLLARAAVDDRRGIAAEHAAARVVEAHPVLRHLLEQDRHAEGVEPAAAILLGRTEAPEARGLGLGGEAPIVLLGDLGGVGIDALLDREQLVADDAPDLLAKRDELGRQRVPGERGHRATLREPPRPCQRSGTARRARRDPQIGPFVQPAWRARRRGGAEAHAATHLSRLRQRIVDWPGCARAARGSRAPSARPGALPRSREATPARSSRRESRQRRGTSRGSSGGAWHPRPGAAW